MQQKFSIDVEICWVNWMFLRKLSYLKIFFHLSHRMIWANKQKGTRSMFFFVFITDHLKDMRFIICKQWSTATTISSGLLVSLDWWIIFLSFLFAFEKKNRSTTNLNSTCLLFAQVFLVSNKKTAFTKKFHTKKKNQIHREWLINRQITRR